MASRSEEIEGALRKDLERSAAARAVAVREATAAKQQFVDATLASKATADKLQAALETSRSARQKAEREAAAANRDLGVARTEQQRLVKELQAAKAANEASQKRVRDLEQELKSAKDTVAPNAGPTAPLSPSGVSETTREAGAAGGTSGEKDAGAPKVK